MCKFKKLHDQLKGDYPRFVFETTARMSADIFTKAFTGVRSWKLACWLISVMHVDDIAKLSAELPLSDDIFDVAKALAEKVALREAKAAEAKAVAMASMVSETVASSDLLVVTDSSSAISSPDPPKGGGETWKKWNQNN